MELPKKAFRLGSTRSKHGESGGKGWPIPGGRRPEESSDSNPLAKRVVWQPGWQIVTLRIRLEIEEKNRARKPSEEAQAASKPLPRQTATLGVNDGKGVMFIDVRNPDLLEGKCGICEYCSLCGGSRACSYALTGNLFASEPDCVYQPEG